jgi:hypothetical protein
MSEACTELDARLEAVANAAAPLGSRLPRVRDPVLGRWMAQQMDTLLRNVTSDYGALDVAIGEGLDALTIGRRAMDVGYSNIGDYAREELGINAGTAVKMARLARRLRDRPLLREAVRRGEVTARKAEIDPWRIDAELKQLVAKRTGWDEVFGHVAMLFKRSRAWEPLGFASFGHYCEERLGMAERTVAQRVALEHSLYRIPLLRRALREKRISYEKARVIARHAEGEEVEGWIEKAETMTASSCVVRCRTRTRRTCAPGEASTSGCR